MENEDLSKFAGLVDESEDVPFFKKILHGTLSFVYTVILCTVFLFIATFANLSGSLFILVAFVVPAGIMAGLYQAGKFNIRLLPVAFGIIFSLPVLLLVVDMIESM